MNGIHFEVIESDRCYVKKYDNGWFESYAKATIEANDPDVNFLQIGSSGIYYARFTNVGIGITVTDVYDIELSVQHNGITWGASPTMNTNMQAVNGYVVQYGADKSRAINIRVHVTGKWK